MSLSKIEKDIHCWVYEFLAKTNELLGWLPVCPYAAKALHEERARIAINTNLFSESFYEKYIPTFDHHKEDILILVSTLNERSFTEFNGFITKQNQCILWKEDVFIMGSHPDDTEEGIELFGTNEYNDEEVGPYPMIFVQKLSDLVHESRKLQKTNYYDNFKVKDYKQLVDEREELYKRMIHHRFTI